MQEENKSNTPLIISIIVIVACICVLVLGVGGYIAYSSSNLFAGFAPIEPDQPNGSDPVPSDVEVFRPEIDESVQETLLVLQSTIVPPNEPKELACRLQGNCDVPDVIATSAEPRKVGDKDKFWVSNLDTITNVEVEAILQYVTPHVYFWVQDGVSFKENEMKELVDTFEEKMYPANREFFGPEWSPGIDGDEHIYILYARGLGSSVAGYFSSSDSVHPLIKEYSNGHEMFLFNADNSFLNEQYTYGVLAHEFQHMIHWNLDLNETSWINEGSAELAVFLNGYDTGGKDWLYISDPDMQLNDWPNDQNATVPHYGAGFIFMTYFLDRFGETATQALVRDPANGLESVDDVLLEINAVDPLTNQPITADDFFMDWATTNFLLDENIADGRYIYHNYPGASRASATETIYNCPQAALTRDVRQYGVDYIAFECEGDFTLSFTGSTVTGVLPADANSGKYAFWSNKGDESDMTLTREFDFTQATGEINLIFQTWYDIETDWDYVYVLASEDGKVWDFVKTPSGTDTDPSGNSYGWGYTGVTNNWKEETVDLSQFAGKKVFIRFEYVTDAAVNGEGFMIDDIKVDAVGYQTDLETDDGGWTAEGFVRVQNVLPQTFGLVLLNSQDSSVTRIQLTPDQTAEIPLSIQSGEKVYLIVSGLTRFTRQPASYQIEVK